MEKIEEQRLFSVGVEKQEEPREETKSQLSTLKVFFYLKPKK